MKATESETTLNAAIPPFRWKGGLVRRRWVYQHSTPLLSFCRSDWRTVKQAIQFRHMMAGCGHRPRHDDRDFPTERMESRWLDMEMKGE